MYGGIFGLDYKTPYKSHHTQKLPHPPEDTSAQSTYCGVHGHILIPTVRAPPTVEDVRMIPVDFQWLITFIKV